MAPTLRHRDRAVFARPRGPLRRGDIVSYRYPRDPRKMFVGRIVGLPGERIGFRGGIVHVDGAPLVEPYLEGVSRPPHDLGDTSLGPDEYFVLGDNRGNSSDSREWGPVAGQFIRKRFVYLWWREGSRLTPPARGRPSR